MSVLGELSPLKRGETLGARVRQELRSAVMAGRFRPGQKLTLRAVAKALDVSLTPAREALYNLAAEGVFEMRGNGSIYVPEVTEERIRELTKIRISLEGLAAREATPHLTEADIDEIVALNDQLLAADDAENYEAVIQLNWRFHFAIYSRSNMPTLLRMIESCWLTTGSYLHLIYPEFGQVSDGIHNHLAIIEAVQRKQPEQLCVAIRRDIEFAAGALVSAIRSKT